MKKLIYLLLCVAIVSVTACSDNDPQSAAVKKNELGLIVPQINASENAILLEDGTLTRPVSGIDNFDDRAVGSKLLFDYQIVGVENGITNIAILNFSEANDSTFTPEPDTVSIDKVVYGSTFSGQYYMANEDSTELHIGHVSFSFGSEEAGTYTYTFTPNEGEPFSGAGDLHITEGLLIFSNNDDENVVVPVGEYLPHARSGSLYLWPVESSGLYRTYVLTVQE
jgi:hypothetical protein